MEAAEFCLKYGLTWAVLSSRESYLCLNDYHLYVKNFLKIRDLFVAFEHGRFAYESVTTALILLGNTDKLSRRVF